MFRAIFCPSSVA